MRLAVVTGPSSGIGREVARGLAARGYHVVAAGRAESRVAPVVSEIIADGRSAEFLELDLASLESVRAAARSFLDSSRGIDALVNNAGVGATTRGSSRDGFQIQFAVNHLGHHVLTRELSPAFVERSRVVQVTSSVHHRASGIDFARLRQRSRLIDLDAYATSKLANVLFVRELARRMPGIDSYAVHPGLVDTKIIPIWSKPFLRGRLLTPTEGADTVIWCATEPSLSGDSGRYFTRRQAVGPSPVASDDELARELWERSEDWTTETP